MSKLEERENRRKSVVGSIIEPVKPTVPGRGRPKEDRETKKRISLAVLPSLYADIQRIAYVERRSVSDLVAGLMVEYRAGHLKELGEYDDLQAGR